MKANVRERIKMVKAMEYIARQINDESVFELWLMEGVADGDISYGDMNVLDEDDIDLEYYLGDDEFSDLMKTFLDCMAHARKSGGLYCGDIVSK